MLRCPKRCQCRVSLPPGDHLERNHLEHVDGVDSEDRGTPGISPATISPGNTGYTASVGQCRHMPAGVVFAWLWASRNNDR
jgi:hypothetical protein